MLIKIKQLMIKKSIILSIVIIMLITSLMSGCDLMDSFLNIKSGTDRDSILKMAKKYYKETEPKVEAGFKAEFAIMVPSTPDFSGKSKDEELVIKTSLQVGGSILSCNAKNYNLALSAAMVAKDADSVTAVMNFAAAVACYFDNNVFDSFDNFRKQAKNKYYEDASKVYSYAIELSKEDGKYTNISLSPLTSLGNLYIDMNKSQDAIPLFDEALSIDQNYSPAIVGKQKALFDLKRFNELQLFLGAAVKNQPVQEKQIDHIGEWLEEIAIEQSEQINTHVSLDPDQIAESIKTTSEVEVISKADALTLLSKEAEEKIRQRLRETQSKIKVKVPDMSLLFDYKDWKEFFTIFPDLPDDSYYLGGEGFWNKLQEYSDKVEEANVKRDQLEEQYSQKYPNEGLEFIGPGIDEKTARLMYLALIDKRFAPLAMNPFDYKNPDDILIQATVMQRYTQRFSALSSYFAAFDGKLGEELDRQTEEFYDKSIKLEEEYNKKLGKIYEKMNNSHPSMDAVYRLQIHTLALSYYPKFKTLYENSWKDSTKYARDTYKKYEETLPIIYNDIMKYIMLVSDKEVQEELQNEVNLQIMEFIDSVNWKIISFYDIGYVRTFDERGLAELPCTEDIMDSEELQETESQILSDMQAKYQAAMSGKEAFDAKVIDENSQLYKEVIEKYEYKVNLGFIQYKTNELRSTTTLGFNLGAAEGDITQTENHYTGAVKMDGNLELGGGIGSAKGAEIGLAGKFGFTVTMDANKNIVPDSVDIRAGLEVGATIGKSLEVKGGIEASVMRGTKAYGNIGLTANELIKDLRIKVEEKKLGRYLTDFEKDAGVFAVAHNNAKLPSVKLWDGKFDIVTPK